MSETLADRLNDAADLIANESQCSDPLADDLYAAAKAVDRVAELGAALQVLDDLWTDTDVHPRHAPGVCEECDKGYAVERLLERGEG